MKRYIQRVSEDCTAAQLHDAAYALLHRALRQDWNIAAPVILKTDLGKPYLSGEQMPYISLSHTRGLVCCAISHRPVGIDCERPRRVSDGALRRVCTPAEQQAIQTAENRELAFLQHWVLKESISKVLGLGLSRTFTDYEITFSGGVPVCTGYTLHLEQVGEFVLGAAE